MKNLEKIMTHIKENDAKNILIHTIPNTQNWLICEKIEIDKWLIALCNPNKTVIYNLGTINEKKHLELWMQLVKKEIETKTNQVKLAQGYREIIRNFIKKERKYENFLKNKIKKNKEKK